MQDGWIIAWDARSNDVCRNLAPLISFSPGRRTFPLEIIGADAVRGTRGKVQLEVVEAHTPPLPRIAVVVHYTLTNCALRNIIIIIPNSTLLILVEFLPRPPSVAPVGPTLILLVWLQGLQESREKG